jgi:hypothetical protein
MRYYWKDKHTEITVEVNRPHTESQVPPDKEEAVEQGMEVEAYAEAEWEKQYSAPAFVGPKSKGYW